MHTPKGLSPDGNQVKYLQANFELSIASNACERVHCNKCPDIVRLYKVEVLTLTCKRRRRNLCPGIVEDKLDKIDKIDEPHREID